MSQYPTPPSSPAPQGGSAESLIESIIGQPISPAGGK